MGKKELAISVKNLHKSFKLPHEQSSGIKQLTIGLFSRNRRKGYEIQHVLKGLDFEIEKGEFYGIVGRNGSGKSTLLKTLAEIYSPEGGSVKINGTLVPFIELGVGFNPELTGRENVFLNGALLGFSRDEMKAMYDDIVEFAELGKFMDQKLKNYSSGMQVRLAFSIAIRADGDILLLDEVLAVGDEAFQRKCNNYFAKLKRDKKTVILVTHSMDAVQQFCTKAMMIDKGRIVAEGNPLDVSHRYQELFVDSSQKQLTDNKGVYNDLFNCRTKISYTEKELSIEAFIKAKEDIDSTVITLGINKDSGEQVFRWISDDRLGRSIDLKKGHEYKLTAKLQNVFPKDSYTIGVRIKDSARVQNYAIFDRVGRFDIEQRKDTPAWDVLWNPEHEVNFMET